MTCGKVISNSGKTIDVENMQWFLSHWIESALRTERQTYEDLDLQSCFSCHHYDVLLCKMDIYIFGVVLRLKDLACGIILEFVVLHA